MELRTTAVGAANKSKAKLKGIDLTRLPDEILGVIVSHLPTNDGARTAAISRRWRHLWRLAPLNLDDGHIPGHEPDRINLVSKLLSEHLLPVRRLKLYRPFDDAWLTSPALDNLEEIDVWICQGRVRPLPVLRFAPTLRVASLGSCSFLHGADPASLSFPHLRKLILSVVTVSSDTLHDVLAGSPVLERLVLESCSGLTCLQVNSPSLRSIVLHGDGSMDELIIQDAPCMERLIRSDCFGTSPIIRIISAPRLLILGSLQDDLAKLKLATRVYQRIDAVGNLKTLMRSVKVLRLNSSGPNLHAVVGFLKLFPCLEKLYIRSFYRLMGKKNVGSTSVNPRDPVDCLDHLKEVGFKFYTGTEEVVNFAKFFVLNAKVLRLMRFGVPISITEEWRAKQHVLLQFGCRASQNARLDFRTDSKVDIYTCSICRRTLSLSYPSSSYCAYCGQFDQIDSVL